MQLMPLAVVATGESALALAGDTTLAACDREMKKQHLSHGHFNAS